MPSFPGERVTEGGKHVVEFSELRRHLAARQGRRNAVEYALIMALVAVFIIAGVLAMSGAIGALFNSMATCLGDAVNCNTATF